MKTLLLHNPKAGDEDVSRDELESALSAAGCEVVYQSIKDQDYHHALDRHTDLIAVAGGDGTMRKVFLHLAQRDTPPILMLANGTANNLARSLGVSQNWREMVGRLHALKPKPFYFGAIRYADHCEYFFESIGFGLFADYLRITETDEGSAEAALPDVEGFKRDRLALAGLASSASVQSVMIESTGFTMKVNSYWLEIMNIPWIGPKLPFYKDDGVIEKKPFQLITANQHHHSQMMTWLTQADITSPPEFERQALAWDTRLTLQARDIYTFHIDDDFRSHPHEGSLTLHVSRVEQPLQILR